MNYKVLALSMVLASSFTAINAEEKKECKKPSNIYIGAGVGAMSVLNDGLNSPTFNFNVKLGKYITPVWGVRAEIGAAWQSLEAQEPNIKGGKSYSDYCKKFAEVNLDGTLSLTNLFLKYNPKRVLDLYVFAGPTMNIASAVSYNQSVEYGDVNVDFNVPTEYPTGGGTITGTVSGGDKEIKENYESEGVKARFGATAGMGLDINLNQKWALNIESRFGVSPSIFGWGSDCRTAEATTRLTVGFKYTFGGKRFCTGKKEPKIVEKEVIKEVVKEVPVEVIKEVVKEVPSAAAAAIFFKIGKSVISEEGMVNVKLMAKTMKNNPTTTYKIAGFADRGTGTVEINQKLSEARAQAVYDALIAEGISADRLEKVAMGGTDPMFEKAYLNRVVIMENK